ncbi:MAG: PocR ligand-binding domain-containing protein [Spirochaetales bacterium]|nr:PocR ligand-binding domain-containing protein [Spirochaetales bacterium]
MNSEPLLSDLVDLERFRRLIDHFYSLTNIGIGVVDNRGEVLIANGWKDICLKFHRRHPETALNCQESDIHLSKPLGEGIYRLYKCKNHMWDMATPIVINGRRMGTIFIGQFFFNDEKIDYDLFRKQAATYGFDEQAYLEALNKVPHWSKETLDTAMAFLSGLTKIIATIGLNNINLEEMLKKTRSLAEELKKKEETLYDVLENIPSAVIAIDMEGTILVVNRTTSEYTGYSREELLHLNVQKIDREIAERRDKENLWRDLPPRGRRTIETTITRKDGTTFPAEIHLSSITLNERKVILSIVQDITEQKKQDQEKQYILKKMNHRIKNNLAMISSLVRLKNDNLPSSIDLTDLAHQVDAIIIVHDILYHTDDVSRIGIADYTRDLLDTVFSSFTEKAVNLAVEIGDFSLPTKTVVPLGLIINEIAVNALKHAFENTEKPLFSISLEASSDDDRFILAISNNGTPFPASIPIDNPTTLGLRLISALTEQLEGTLELIRSPETTFIIRFPVQETSAL